VSAEDGRWAAAELLGDQGPWAWRLWRATLALPPGRHELRVRAWDNAGATQPEHPGDVWNPKGYANRAWGRMELELPAGPMDPLP
jgi:sulfite oxidase